MSFDEALAPAVRPCGTSSWPISEPPSTALAGARDILQVQTNVADDKLTEAVAAAEAWAVSMSAIERPVLFTGTARAWRVVPTDSGLVGAYVDNMLESSEYGGCGTAADDAASLSALECLGRAASVGQNCRRRGGSHLRLRDYGVLWVSSSPRRTLLQARERPWPNSLLEDSYALAYVARLEEVDVPAASPLNHTESANRWIPACREIDRAGAAPHAPGGVHRPRLVVGLATAGASAVAWWAIDAAVAVPITIVAVVTVLAAIVDSRIARIPNSASATAFVVALISIPFVATLDDRPLASTAIGALAGVVYSGAPVLFLIWLIRPNSIGGGDWKMLGAIGCSIGLVLPVAALVMATVACLIQITISAVRRVATMPFGPSIAAALIVTLCLLPALGRTFGGPYA